MEPRFQTSFIPKNPVAVHKEDFSHTSISLFSILAIVFFVGSLVSSVFVFIEKRMIMRDTEETKSAIDLEKSSFDKKGADELILASDQMRAVKGILDKHIAISNLFLLLESLTIPNVSFKSFSFDAKGKGIVSVSIEMSAPSFSYLARQEDLLKSSQYIKDIKITGINKEESGLIKSTLNIDIDSKTVSYKEALEKLSLLEKVPQTN